MRKITLIRVSLIALKKAPGLSVLHFRDAPTEKVIKISIRT